MRAGSMDPSNRKQKKLRSGLRIKTRAKQEENIQSQSDAGERTAATPSEEKGQTIDESSNLEPGIKCMHF
jgi:hypothetical protein